MSQSSKNSCKEDNVSADVYARVPSCCKQQYLSPTGKFMMQSVMQRRYSALSKIFEKNRADNFVPTDSAQMPTFNECSNDSQ